MIEQALARGRKVVFIAHRKELIDQASARLDEHDIDHGIIMANHWRYRPDAPVQVCSIATLVRRGSAPPADFLVFDECHHCAAGSYVKIAERYPNAWSVGLTASPWRLDGKGLADHFDDSVLAARPKDLIEQGFLINYVGYKYLAPDVSGVRIKGNDYDNAQLENACSDSRIVGDVVKEWLEHASSLRTIVFAVNLKHAYVIADAFRYSGIAAETVEYKMTKYERETILERVRSGETRVIVNVAILGEGVDIPALECVVLARPTKSLSMYLQQVGRILRPSRDTGKTVARIHDHAELVDRFGLPDDDRDYSLRATRQSNERERSEVMKCPVCLAVFARSEYSGRCPECGAVLAQPGDGAERAGPDNVNGVAVDIRTAAAVKRDRDAWLAEMVKVAIEKGFKPGWIVHQHERQFPGQPKPWGSYRQIREAQRDAVVRRELENEK